MISWWCVAVNGHPLYLVVIPVWLLVACMCWEGGKMFVVLYFWFHLPDLRMLQKYIDFFTGLDAL